MVTNRKGGQGGCGKSPDAVLVVFPGVPVVLQINFAVHQLHLNTQLLPDCNQSLQQRENKRKLEKKYRSPRIVDTALNIWESNDIFLF